MEKKYIQGSLVKADDGGLDFIASDETRDRQGEVIPLESWDLKNFIKAPRMLVDHWHSVENIVGKWDNIRIETGGDRPGLKMRAIFHNFTELAKETAKMVKGGFLDTVSVGFIPHTDMNENNEEIERNELIEVSLVTVPANPNAVQIRSLINTGKEKEHSTEIDKFVNGEEIKEVKADEVIKIKDKPAEIKKETPMK